MNKIKYTSHSSINRYFFLQPILTQPILNNLVFVNLQFKLLCVELSIQSTERNIVNLMRKIVNYYWKNKILN